MHGLNYLSVGFVLFLLICLGLFVYEEGIKVNPTDVEQNIVGIERIVFSPTEHLFTFFVGDSKGNLRVYQYRSNEISVKTDVPTAGKSWAKIGEMHVGWRNFIVVHVHSVDEIQTECPKDH